MGIIYCYTNKINGKKYIGQTIHPEQRKRNHEYEALKTNSDYYFHRAIRKHGLENFSYEVLEETENLSERETFFIKEYNTLWPNGYNEILEHNAFDYKIRKKISETKKQQWKNLSVEKKKKILLYFNNRGKHQTQKQKKAVMEANQKQWKVVNPEGKEMEITNLRKFCKENGLDQGNMVKVADGKIKQSKKWKCFRIE